MLKSLAISGNLLKYTRYVGKVGYALFDWKIRFFFCTIVNASAARLGVLIVAGLYDAFQRISPVQIQLAREHVHLMPQINVNGCNESFENIDRLFSA